MFFRISLSAVVTLGMAAMSGISLAQKDYLGVVIEGVGSIVANWVTCSLVRSSTETRIQADAKRRCS